MSWFRRSYDIQALCKISDAAMMRAELSGRALDKRGTTEPWRIPMDHAAAAGNVTLVRVLLELGSPVWGSSIHEALLVDAVDVLRPWHEADPHFYRQFWREKEFSSNPRLNRWTSNFTALDYARSIGARESTSFLASIGAPSKPTFRKCRSGCLGIYIEDDQFLAMGGVNIDGRSLRTEGYYCAKCNSFQNW